MLLKYKHNISQSTMLNILKQNEFKLCKITKKFDLIEEIKKT